MNTTSISPQRVPGRLCLAAALVASLSASMGAVGCSDSARRSHDPETVRGAIEDSNRSFMEAARSGDAEAMAARFTEGAQILPPNGESVRGRSEIAAFWRATLEAGVTGARLAVVELEVWAEGALEVGEYQLTGDAGAILDDGKYIVVWKHTEGEWRMHRDIWNSDRPPPPMADLALVGPAP